MLISHKFKFITVNIPKTGTRSLRETLGSLNCIDVTGKNGSKYEQHEPAYQIREKIESDGFIWSEYFKYTVVRNPWERYVSYLMWAKNFYEEEILKNTKKSIKFFEASAYVKYLLEKNNFENKKILKKVIEEQKNQEYFITDSNRNIIVDYVAKFENIEEEFIKFCKKVGIKKIPKLKHKNKNIFYDYRNYYDKNLYNKVKEKEKFIIEKYGYKFKFDYL